MGASTIQFIHGLSWQGIPESVKNMTRRCLLDLLGVAASGTATDLSRIINNHVVEQFGSGAKPARLLFDGRNVSPAGAALAGSMTIDSIDAHDGHKLCKGHVGCGVLPGWLAFLEQNESTTEAELLTGLLIGYEIGSRAGIALHASACDYHTSGAWISLAVAALGARALGLDENRTREALGIAEYHGPRSQMMRTIDHPTMVKDGSGWGAMAGVSAAFLARDGFTGAPAITVEYPQHAELWGDLGERWHIQEQYFKPYPVCRWAQPGIIAALKLKQEHGFQPDQIRKVRLGTFHESYRLATAAPRNTEQAQYSAPFPVAAALVHGRVGVEEISGKGLKDEAVLKLSCSVELYEVEAFNHDFPARRISQLTIELQDGRVLESGPTEADGDPESPLTTEQIDHKFMEFATPPLGEQRARDIRKMVKTMGTKNSIVPLQMLIYPAGAFQ